MELSQSYSSLRIDTGVLNSLTTLTSLKKVVAGLLTPI